tara:strand:- start:4235 stop:4552 length:318 start_codon:yes stop_codon:yes gene_type:complete
MRTAARVDINHQEIKLAFEKLGFATKNVSQLKGFCDLCVSHDDRTFLIEIKDGEKSPSARRLTEAEQIFHDRWQDTVYIITSIEDVVTFVKMAREKPHFQGRRNK